MKKIILPLDGMIEDEAFNIVNNIYRNNIRNEIWGFKVNDLLIDCGLNIIRKIKSKGFRVMADPKLYDIPNTMTNSIKKLIDAGADIITVHCMADYDPIEQMAPYLAGVTVLTSMKPENFERYGLINSINLKDRFNIPALVRNMTNIIDFKDYGYVVCSPMEVEKLSRFPIKKICPGIRPEWYQEKDDQERTTTPKDAVKAGADLLVIGRPILKSDNIIEAIKRTNEEIYSK